MQQTSSDLGRFLVIKPGVILSFRGAPHRVKRISTPERVLVENLDTHQVESAYVHQLSAYDPAIANAEDGPTISTVPELETFTKEEQERAQKIYSVLEPVLDPHGRTRQSVEQAAKKLGKSVGTVYKLIGGFDGAGLAGLIPGKRGPKGGYRLKPRVEEIIEEIVEEVYLNSQKKKQIDVIGDVKERCEAEGLPVPHDNTIRNRITSLPRNVVLRRRGHKKEANANLPVPGEFPKTSGPLSIVQMDHTPLDILVVFAGTRKPWGRPWLTLVIDVETRVIVGFYLSMSRPSSVAAGMAIAMGILPKNDYLGSLGLTGNWPVCGIPRRLHCDNAREFKGKTLEKAGREYRIDLQLRPVKTPEYGGHIERMVGNVNHMLHRKPGTTFSNIKQRETYDSKKKSAYTLRELEIEIADWIVNHYHQTKHSALGKPPIRAWEQGVMGGEDKPGIGLPVLPTDPERLKLDFMPGDTRVVQNTGIRWGRSDYYNENLNHWINATDPEHPTEKRKFEIRHHPQIRNKIWFLDPETKQYYEIPKFPADEADDDGVGYDEHLDAEKLKHKAGLEMEDKEAKRGYRRRSKEREQEAVKTTQKARRSQQKASYPDKPRATDASEIESRMRPQSDTEGRSDNPFAALSKKSLTGFPVRSK